MEIIEKIRQELEDHSDPETKMTGNRFFKEEVKFYGVKTSVVSEMSRKYFEQVRLLSKDTIFNTCEELLRSDYNEEAWIAFDMANRISKQFTPGDFERFETWIDKYVNNWAKCDTLCNHAVGTFMEMYPQYVQELKKWAHSKNRWFRRAASVTLILPARKGKYLKDVLQISDILISDNDDMVQKGYGWLLKEASKEHLNEVYAYLIKNKSIMPRTALRYAIEKMPPDFRENVMKK